jgi:hypothetical protein
MVNAVVPVFVTVTTDCVTVLLSRLLPKLKELPLKAAFVEVGGVVGLTVRAVVMLWLSEPDVPWSDMVALPAAAAGVAVTLICCSPPGAMDNVIGVAVTPLGKAPTATLTFPAKPFVGEELTVRFCAAPPGAIVTDAGTIARVKSADPVVVLPDDPVVPLFGLLPPLLHPAKTVSKEIAHRKVPRDFMRSAPS